MSLYAELTKRLNHRIVLSLWYLYSSPQRAAEYAGITTPVAARKPLPSQRSMSKLCQFCKWKEATEDEAPGLLPQTSLMRVAHRLPGIDCLANVLQFITQKDCKHWKLLGISVPIAEVKDAWRKPRLEKTTSVLASWMRFISFQFVNLTRQIQKKACSGQRAKRTGTNWNSLKLRVKPNPSLAGSSFQA